MKTNNYFKIIFNTVFVLALAIVSLNACQDSGGRKPVNKVKPGKNRDGKLIKKMDLQDAETENLVKLFTEMSHDFQDAWSVAIQSPHSKPNNIFEFIKVRLSDKLLIKRIEDKKVSCENKVPYLFKQNDGDSKTKVLYRVGLYDCANSNENDIVTITFDESVSTYKIVWNYGATNEYIESGVLPFINGLKSNCLINWVAADRKIDKIVCSDLGQSFRIEGYTNPARIFKSLIIEGSNKVLKLEWLDYGIKGSEEPKKIAGSHKTAEKSTDSNIYICPALKDKSFLDCKEYYDKCDESKANANPISCEGEADVKSSEDIPAVVNGDEKKGKADDSVPVPVNNGDPLPAAVDQNSPSGATDQADVDGKQVEESSVPGDGQSKPAKFVTDSAADDKGDDEADKAKEDQTGIQELEK